MGIHSARSCLLRRGEGHVCVKSDCRIRQRVLENYLKLCAKRILASIIVVKERTANPVHHGVVDDQLSRGRSKKRSILIHRCKRETSHKRVPLRKPLRYGLCGGAPKEIIQVKRYIEAYRLCNIPLKPKINLRHEATLIGTHYYRQHSISDSKRIRIWKFHRDNYCAISQEFRRSKELCMSKEPSSTNRNENFTVNVCCGIMENVVHKHQNSVDLVERQQFAASVCCRIAAEVLHSSTEMEVDDISNLMEKKDAPSIFNQTNSSDTIKTRNQIKNTSNQDKTCSEDIGINERAELRSSAAKYHDEDEGGEDRSTDGSDIFSSVGLSANVAKAMTRSEVPCTNTYKASLDQNAHVVEIDASWRKLPIKTSCGGKRRLGGEWTTFFNNIINKYNPHCVFAFKNNNIKQQGSRKQKSPFFKANAICTISPCQCKALLQIQNETSNQMILQFVGNTEHDSSILKARRITGSERQNIKQQFIDSRQSPSSYYRNKLRDLDNESYASGNRSGSGVNPKAFQHISSEANAVRNDVSIMADKIRKCDEKIREENQQLHKSVMNILKIPGYVQSNDITSDSLSIVLCDEGSIRLYRHVCLKDIIFLDATGTIVEKVRGVKRILLYSLTTRNPFGKSPPVPLAEMISSTHTTGAIKRMLTVLREKEKTLYGNNAIPLAIRTDFSMAMIAACISEFNNGITVTEYLDQCFDIVSGVDRGSRERLTLQLICSAHLMKTNAKNVETRAQKGASVANQGSIKHLAMRIVGVLVNTERLGDALVIIRLAYIAFMSQTETPQLQDALARLSQIVNDFNLPKMDTDNDTDVMEDTVEEQRIRSNGKMKDCIERELQLVDFQAEQGTSDNKYYLPSYMDYLRNTLLPYLPMWSRIMLQTESNTELKECMKDLHKMAGKTFLDGGSSNAYAENYFTFVKQSFTTKSVPTDKFIYRHFNDIQGLRRQYLDTIRTACAAKTKGKSKKSRQFAAIERATPRYPNDIDLLHESESDIEPEVIEQWNKPSTSKGQSRISGTYQEPPATPLNFNASRKKAANKKTKPLSTGVSTNDDRMRFQVFKVQHYASISKEQATTDACLEELKERYLRLSDKEKSKINIPRAHQDLLYCICKKRYKQSDPTMVRCDICFDWYHHTCIHMGAEFLSLKIPRYHCNNCTELIFRGLTNYIGHFDGKVHDSGSHAIKDLYDEFCSLDPQTKQIVLNHTYLPREFSRSLASFSVLNHERGIRNENMNCWLSSLVHVVCGTGISDLLLSYKGSSGLEISRFLSMCKIRLAKRTKGPLTLKMIQDFALILDPEAFNPNNEGQKDAAEFYACLISNFVENVPCEGLFIDLKVVSLELRYCTNCRNIAGSCYSGTFFRVAVKDSETQVSLNDLIWAQLRGEYYENDAELAKNICDPLCKAPSLWEVTFLRNFPSILVINLKRGEWKSNDGRINQTPVIIPRHLDLTEYAARKTNERYRYELKAIVSHYAITSANGHYASHIIDGSMVRTYDDLTVKSRRVNNFLELAAIQTSAHLLFYFMEPDVQATERTRNTRVLSVAEQKIAEKYWFGLLAPETLQLTLHDVRTALPGANVNGDIISQFLREVASNSASRSIITTSGQFLNLLQSNCDNSAECNNILQRDDILTRDAVIIPVHVNANHWIISAIYPKARCVVVVDSLRDATQGKATFARVVAFLRMYAEVHSKEFSIQEWVFIYPRHLPCQDDVVSCGVFACVNGFNCMLQGRSYTPTSQNILYFRYWMTFVACSSAKTPEKLTMPRRRWRTEEIDIQSRDIMIRNMVPGYAKVNNFFEAVEKYVDCRIENSKGSSRACSNQATEKAESVVPQSKDTEAKRIKKNEDHNNSNQVTVSSGDSSSDDSCDSVDRERIQVNAKLEQLSALKEKLLKRINLRIEGANERYIILAKYGKEALLKLFRKELAVICEHVLESDMNSMKGALYKLFCNVVPEHQYFGVSLPTIERNRYGLTSVQFIDYVILPDALCLDLMENNSISYEEAVSTMCGEERSRLTVYWHLVLRKDNRVYASSSAGNGCQIQAVVGQLHKERAHAIVAIVNNQLQAANEESKSLLLIAGVNQESLSIELTDNGDDLLPSAVITCKPGNLRCDKLILLVAGPATDIEHLVEYLHMSLKKILKKAAENGLCTIAMPLLAPKMTEKQRKEVAARQIEFAKEHISAAEDCALSVINIVTSNSDDCSVIKDAMMS